MAEQEASCGCFVRKTFQNFVTFLFMLVIVHNKSTFGSTSQYTHGLRSDFISQSHRNLEDSTQILLSSTSSKVKYTSTEKNSMPSTSISEKDSSNTFDPSSVRQELSTVEEIAVTSAILLPSKSSVILSDSSKFIISSLSSQKAPVMTSNIQSANFNSSEICLLYTSPSPRDS